MSRKNAIKLSESELKKVITESVKTVLNELTSDFINQKYQQAIQKRNRALHTPEWGRRNRQVDAFRQGYADAYNKEHGYDGRTEGGDVATLQFNDKLPDGTPLRVFVSSNSVWLRCNYFDNAIDVGKLIRYKNYQKNFCIFSPKVAQQIAQWFSQNRNPNYADQTEEACNPEFWTQYHEGQQYNPGHFQKMAMY